MRLTVCSAFAAAAFLASILPANAIGANDAQQMYDNWNNAFLVYDGKSANLSHYIHSTAIDGGWTESEAIFAAEDAFFRTGNDTIRDIILALATTWVERYPTTYNSKTYNSTWNGDCWNDDIAWYSIMLSRAYQITQSPAILEKARYGNDLVWSRGWDTKHNDGGIWETQPAGYPDACKSGDHKDIKLGLSTNSNALASCYIYQATHNDTYLDRCKTIYAWSRSHLFNTTTGALISGVEPDGTPDNATPTTNAGHWVDLANLLWMATGEAHYYTDAKAATNYALHNLSSKTNPGIFSTNQVDAPQAFGPIGRGVGNFARDNQLWDLYYAQFVDNADLIVKNRDPTYGLTWHEWLNPTPDPPKENSNLTVDQYSNSVTWLQQTPPFNPSNLTIGLRTIQNVQTKLFISSVGSFVSKQPVDLKPAATSSQGTQRWRITPNQYGSGHSFNLENLHSWQALTAENNTASALDQDFAMRKQNQRWYIANVGSNTYSIINKDTGLALDGGSSTKSGSPLTQTKYTGAQSQKWYLDTLPVPT